MKNKTLSHPLVLKPVHVNEPKPTKSLRPSRSMIGLKSLRPKHLPVVAAEMIKTIH